MIHICPYCGRNVSRAIEDGITTCNNCSRIFDSSSFHKTLAAAWYVIRNNLDNIDFVADMFKLDENDKNLIVKYIVEEGYHHDDFQRILKSLR